MSAQPYTKADLAHVWSEHIAKAIAEAIAIEQERCARIADAYVRACGSVNGREAGETISKMIRALA